VPAAREREKVKEFRQNGFGPPLFVRQLVSLGALNFPSNALFVEVTKDSPEVRPEAKLMKIIFLTGLKWDETGEAGLI
jgi:hypothetical protein